MVAVDDGYRRRCHPTPIRPGAAFRGRAREHPISPFGNGSSFGRWSPLVGLGHKSRRTHSLKGSSFGRWSPLVGLGHKSRRTHSLKGIVHEVAARTSRLQAVGGRSSNVLARRCQRGRSPFLALLGGLVHVAGAGIDSLDVRLLLHQRRHSSLSGHLRSLIKRHIAK